MTRFGCTAPKLVHPLQSMNNTDPMKFHSKGDFLQQSCGYKEQNHIYCGLIFAGPSLSCEPSDICESYWPSGTLTTEHRALAFHLLFSKSMGTCRRQINGNWYIDKNRQLKPKLKLKIKKIHIFATRFQPQIFESSA